ncbi:hypothetical protein SAMN02745181_3323 [Rubritalea squalenifaciens DSM 18772]|uniref:STAS domain-containing protein n=1 Tax=Rubritalea squalenifaciens DSM 18772 TaxID=1123071 RepID=A0A1M6PWJ7_9BACT|nr:hypothetical protein SAMN02745181_3323 [Rubritalea squalenifaciens DSM 18772]
MSNTNAIYVGAFDESIWVRCEGKGSFMNSPLIKTWVDQQLEAGCKWVVVDLEPCTGMDSTFMGTLAGIAMRLNKLPEGKMDVISAGEKNSQSLDDLGLSALMSICEDEGDLAEKVKEYRPQLQEFTPGATVGDRTQHVFDAHKTLVEADDSNTEKFSTVLDCLEAELASRRASS